MSISPGHEGTPPTCTRTYSGVGILTRSAQRSENDWIASLRGAARTKIWRGKDPMNLGGGVRDNIVKFGSSLKALIKVEPISRLSMVLEGFV
jgi:hypothetical protein